jgi:hypothetical protein
MQRMWINQPSQWDVLHKYHGTNVLMDTEKRNDGFIAIYFLEGETVSMVIPSLALSQGWRSETGIFNAKGLAVLIKHLQQDEKEIEKLERELEARKKAFVISQMKLYEAGQEVYNS